jgi:ribulose kinase
MDARSAPQTRHIFETCQGDPCLDINSGGEGPLSAEWMLPKALWIYENEKETVWTKAKVICEYQDYINFKLTGVLCASSCNAAARWHWNGQTCLQDASDDNKYPGRPMSLYQTLGIPELADKLPQKCLAMGSLVGSLTQEAAHHLGLPTRYDYDAPVPLIDYTILSYACIVLNMAYIFVFIVLRQLEILMIHIVLYREAQTHLLA